MMKITVSLLTFSNALSFSLKGAPNHSLLNPNSRLPICFGSRSHNVLSNFRSISSTVSLQMGKPKSGSIVDSYQTVSVNCKKCRTRLFRYKKKNGTKSNLIKCYVERISEDCQDLVKNKIDDSTEWHCPNCETRFGKDSMIHGRPAIKLVGGKTQMTKK